MQYSVRGTDGKEYGPVDLSTLKSWVTEGRVTAKTEIIDHLSNQTMLASSIEDLGLSAPPAATYYNMTDAPPSSYTEYPRSEEMQVGARKTRLWSIVFWLCLAFVLSLFVKSGGIIISAWNIFDAFQARAQRDPKAGLCMGVAIGGFLLIALWTYIKYQVVK